MSAELKPWQFDLEQYIRQGEQEFQSADISDSKCNICTLEELAVLRLIKNAPDITQKELAAEIGKSERTIKKITVELQKKGLIKRENGKRNGRWAVRQL